MKKFVPIILLIFVLLIPLQINGVKSPNTQTIPNVALSPGTTIYRSTSPNCYSVTVNMTVTNNSILVQSVVIQNFYILIILANQPVANTTNTSFFNPNNLVTNVLLFPNIPVILEISFQGVCLPNGTNPATDIKLVYYDGSSLISWSPTFIPGNKITWS